MVEGRLVLIFVLVELLLLEVGDLLPFGLRIELHQSSVADYALGPGFLESAHSRTNLRWSVIISSQFFKVGKSLCDGAQQCLLLGEKLTHFMEVPVIVS